MSRTVQTIDVGRFREMAPLEMPNYSLDEAALYLGIAPSSLRKWVCGYEFGPTENRKFSPPVIRLPQSDRTDLSHLNLVEAYVLEAIRKTSRIPLQRIRVAVEYAAKHLGIAHPLASPDLQTDKFDLFIQQAEGDIINVSMKNKVGQMALRDLIAPYLKRIEFDSEGLPARFYLITRPEAGAEAPRTVEIRPLISGGRPILVGTRIAVETIGMLFAAGDEPEDIAEEYGLSSTQVNEAIRSWLILQQRAARVRGSKDAA